MSQIGACMTKKKNGSNRWSLRFKQGNRDLHDSIAGKGLGLF